MAQEVSTGRLRDKVAIVTGSAGGIGKAIVELFLSQGAKVAAFDLAAKPERFSELEANQAGTALNPEVAVLHYWQLDITDEESVSRAVAEVAARFGSIDVLVNTAAIIGVAKKAHEYTGEEFDQMFRVNVKGSWLLTKHTVPHFIANGRGSIVNFSSIAALVGGTNGQALYHATKGAIRSMTKADAVSYAANGIRVNSVHPGSVETEMSKLAAAGSSLGAEAYNASVFAKHPLGRRAKPEEIAYGVLYLASDESSFVTGTELVIDGGYTAW